MMKSPSGLLLALLLGAALPAQGAIYKWTDSHGQVHYTQQPPTGAKATQIAPAPPLPAGAGAASAALKSRLDAMQKAQKAHNKAAQKKRNEARRAALRAQNCRNARSNLRALTSGGRKRFRLPNGTVRYLTPEQIQARTKQAREQIAKSCGTAKGG